MKLYFLPFHVLNNKYANEIDYMLKIRIKSCTAYSFPLFQQEQDEEDIPTQKLRFYDNKEAVDQLMNKENGLLRIIDDASRQLQDAQYIFERIKEHKHGIYVKPMSSHEFTVAHYTGKLIYDASEIAAKNRDFVPPEMIGTMRYSSNDEVKQMFINKLTKSGNLTIVHESCLATKKTSKNKWSALMQESSNFRVSEMISKYLICNFNFNNIIFYLFKINIFYSYFKTFVF